MENKSLNCHHLAYGVDRTASLTMPDGMQQAHNFSEDSANEIDPAVRKIVDGAFSKTQDILNGERNLLDKGAQFLLQKKTCSEGDLNTKRSRKHDVRWL